MNEQKKHEALGVAYGFELANVRAQVDTLLEEAEKRGGEREKVNVGLGIIFRIKSLESAIYNFSGGSKLAERGKKLQEIISSLDKVPKGTDVHLLCVALWLRVQQLTDQQYELQQAGKKVPNKILVEKTQVLSRAEDYACSSEDLDRAVRLFQAIQHMQTYE